MLIYPDSNPNSLRYGTLDRGSLIVQVMLAGTGEDLLLEGVKPSCSVQELCEAIASATGIHRSRQRLFIGGEEMKETSTLLSYYSTSHNAHLHGPCRLTLRCFVPLLLSTTCCPGPMLTEIEVRPRYDEPVLYVKRRIRDKFRIEIENQRLHVHPSQMTSSFLRRPLDDARLLSAYLSPSGGGNFLELIVVEKIEQTRYNESEKELYIRIPHDVINTRRCAESGKLRYSNKLHCPPPKVATEPQTHQYNPPVVENLPPPPPPQTPESDLQINDNNKSSPCETPSDDPFSTPSLETWWVTISIKIDKIIKRDPTVENIVKILMETLAKSSIDVGKLISPKETQLNPVTMGNNLQLVLMYCDVKFSKGGKKFKPGDLIFENLLMRREEMLMFLWQQHGLENMNKIPTFTSLMTREIAKAQQPFIPPLSPLGPLESYTDDRVRFTSPSEPVKMHWNIEPDNVIDYGAKPGIDCELTGVSYTRKYGSWDIPEHEKTYVEVIVEGSCNVGDHGYADLLEEQCSKGFNNLDHNKDLLLKRDVGREEEKHTQRIIYYVQDSMEIVIFGPFNPSTMYRPSAMFLSKPFGISAKKFVEERKEIFAFQQEIRRGELKNPPMPRPAPFYMRINERHVQKTTPLPADTEQSWEDRRQLSKNVIGQWCLSRERITDIAVCGNSQESAPSLRVFTSQCSRGTTKDGRPFLKVLFERRVPVSSTAELIFPRRPHLDLIRNSFDFRIQAQFQFSQLVTDPIDLGEKADFKISTRHWVSRIEHYTHTPDDCVQFESPPGSMDTIFKIDLATSKWLNSIETQPLPTIELQQQSS